MTQKYDRPPVVQAVIEIAFVSPTTAEDRQRLRARLEGAFPNVEELVEVEFQFQVPPGGVAAMGKSDLKLNATGFKLTSADATQIVQISKTSLSITQLAPYEGWDVVRELFDVAYKPARKIFGGKALERIGVRYINRLDISEPDVYQTEKYIDITLTMPKPIAPSAAYQVTYETTIGERPYLLRVMSGGGESPLLDHTALLLDIDVMATVDLPKFDADIGVVLEELRGHKNDVFEMMITEETRKLIGVRGDA